jgi:hypothetical protein
MLYGVTRGAACPRGAVRARRGAPRPGRRARKAPEAALRARARPAAAAGAPTRAAPTLSRPCARQAERLAAKGATFLDVRPAYQFEREHVEGAVNVPMFRKVAGSSNWDNLKRVVMRFGLAMEATGAPPGSRRCDYGL